MTDAPSPRCSSGSRGPFAWRCNDEYYPHIFGLVTDRQVTVDAWRAGGIKFEALYSADSASSPTPQIAGGVRERAESSIECLRAPDPALKAVPNTVRQALAEVIEQLLAALSPQAQAGGVAQAAPDRIAELQYEAGMYQSLYEVAKGRLEYMESKYGKIDWDAYPVPSTDRKCTCGYLHGHADDCPAISSTVRKDAAK